MGRILAIDYGKKRVGLAITDPLKIIATALDTVAAAELENYLLNYLTQNDVERIVIGMPIQMNGQPSESQRYILPFVNRLRKLLPDMPIDYVDERYTSKIANRAIIDGGASKKLRADKGLVDRVSAVIILQSYMSDTSSNF